MWYIIFSVLYRIITHLVLSLFKASVTHSGYLLTLLIRIFPIKMCQILKSDQDPVICGTILLQRLLIHDNKNNIVSWSDLTVSSRICPDSLVLNLNICIFCMVKHDRVCPDSVPIIRMQSDRYPTLTGRWTDAGGKI